MINIIDVVHVLASLLVTTKDISPGATHTRVSCFSRVNKKLIKIIVGQKSLEVVQGYLLGNVNVANREVSKKLKET